MTNKSSARNNAGAIEAAESDVKALYATISQRLGPFDARRVFKRALAPPKSRRPTFHKRGKDGVLLRWQRQMKALAPHMSDREFAEFMYEFRQDGSDATVGWGQRQFGSVVAIMRRLRQLRRQSASEREPPVTPLGGAILHAE
jgi:hypothetical protein